ncbi:porin family protein [Halomonas cerina]|uniref:Outer membrane autotransporter protein n=1 Tax=Halomonas cerina TaxID=447424 RepID=A0A839VBR1_9GAMM|nr:porin family protein [Halomonas cerina]MBB3189936.1 outer membrane autotransporter protein [Halomonas cerina]
MKTSVITASSLAALLVTGAVQAQSGPLAYQPSPYVGADAMYWELDRNGRSDFDSTGLRLRGGVAFNDYLAIEGHLGTGGSDGSVDLDYLAGGYVKGMLPITQAFKVYGLLGGTEVEFERTDSESDFSYGAGASYAVTPNLAVGADYMRYLEESDFDFDAASIGLTYRF